jgi:FixJ family two-component response regulator
MNIVIVDDDFMILEKVKDLILEKLNIEVVAFQNERRFVQNILDFKEFNMFIFDYCMPTFSGFDLASRVLSMNKKAKIIIFTYSGQNIPDEDVLFLEQNRIRICEKTDFEGFGKALGV